MLREALGYPLESEDLTRNYGIAVLLTIGSILIIPAFILIGYYLKAMRETLDGSDQIPEFEDYKSLLGDGLRFSGLLILYTIAVILPVATLNSIGSAVGLADAAAFVNMLFILGVFYAIPASMVNFARENSFRAAFDIGYIKRTAGREKYVKGIGGLLGGALLISVAELIAILFLTVTVIGMPALLIVMPAMRFYEYLFFFRYMPQFCTTEDSN